VVIPVPGVLLRLTGKDLSGPGDPDIPRNPPYFGLFL